MEVHFEVPGSRLAEAFALAAYLHRNQTRKVAKGEDPSLAVPYLTHLTEVMSL